MNLQEKIQRVVARTRAFYQKTEPGHLLIQTDVPSGHKGHDPFDSFDFSRDEEVYRLMDQQLENARAGWLAKEGLDDDEIPCIHPRFGYAEHVAWLGSPVTLQPTTSHPEPFVDDDFDPNSLTTDENRRWFQIMKRAYDYLRSKKDGSFVLSVRGASSPMEIAQMIRGEEILMDFMDEDRQEWCHAMISRITDIYPWYLNHLRSWCDEVEGGHVLSYFKVWMGPNAVGSLSNDIAIMCSPETYLTFGFPYEKRLCEQYGSVLYHTHTQKVHFHKDLCRLPNLTLLQYENDPQVPNAPVQMDHILEASGDAKLHITGNSQEVRENLHKFAGRNVYLKAWCKSHEDAQDLIALVRKQSKPII